MINSIHIYQETMTFSGYDVHGEKSVNYVLNNTCDDEKYFDLVCEFWNNDNELSWDCLDDLETDNRAWEIQ